MYHLTIQEQPRIRHRPRKKTGKTGSSLQGNFVIWREKIKKYIRETLPHWREIYPAGGKFCPPCREIKKFSRPDQTFYGKPTSNSICYALELGASMLICGDGAYPRVQPATAKQTSRQQITSSRSAPFTVN